MLQYLPPWVIVYCFVLVGILGLFLGSAMNCLCYRMVHNEKWSGKERSHCPSCGHILGFWDLFPLFSFVFLRGKCRYCGKKISLRYPLTELLLSVALMSMLARFDLSLDFLSGSILCICLFCLSMVDLDSQIIPDRFLAIPAIVRCCQLLYEGGFRLMLASLIPGLIIGASVLLISLLMDKILKKESMGGGDIKLFAILGLFFSLEQCMLLVILSCIVGIIIASVFMHKDRKSAFPLGPAISLAAWFTLLFGQAVTQWYMALFI